MHTATYLSKASLAQDFEHIEVSEAHSLHVVIAGQDDGHGGLEGGGGDRRSLDGPVDVVLTHEVGPACDGSRGGTSAGLRGRRTREEDHYERDRIYI